MRVLAIGEVLFDVFPEGEHLGGAALNFCVNVSRLGNAANLITALGDDPRGRSALDAMHRYGLPTDLVEIAPDLPTGIAQVTSTPEGERFALSRPAAYDHAASNPRTLQAAGGFKPDWLYFGTLIQMEPRLERITQELLHDLPTTRSFYDMNLRPGNWTPELVDRLGHRANIVKLNEHEARTLAPLAGLEPSSFSLAAFCENWTARYAAEALCITRGAEGCLLYRSGEIQEAPGFQTVVADTVGAGDAFAAAFLHGYNSGWPLPRIARFANILGSIVASRAGAIPDWSPDECYAGFATASIP